MTSTGPQFFKNSLEPVQITAESLENTLQQLRSAVETGVRLIKSKCPLPDKGDLKAYGDLFHGDLGIALMFLRLHRQKSCLADTTQVTPDFLKLALERINPYALQIHLQPGRPSPIMSASLGAVVMRIMASCAGNNPETAEGPNKSDIKALHEAMQIAIQQGLTVERHGGAMGGDEQLYGRSGVLWAAVHIHQLVSDEKTRTALQLIFDNIPQLVDAIVEAGKAGAAEFILQNGNENAMPLMWPWINNFYGLGAMHGMTGIFTILISALALDPTNLQYQTYIPLIASSITTICTISISNSGHLPISIPPRPSSSHRSTPLLQMCHGAPALLLLLAQASNHPGLRTKHWSPLWTKALQVASDKTWEQGLLSKGGGLCHGISGNAWPWLILHDSLSYPTNPPLPIDTNDTNININPASVSPDTFLSRGLSFLLYARETKPFRIPSDEATPSFRMPDHPFSLFEGLAGTMAAWAEACVVLEAKLRGSGIGIGIGIVATTSDPVEEGVGGPMDDEKNVADEAALLKLRLGFPGLGGLAGENPTTTG